jgi:hypothetical protein
MSRLTKADLEAALEQRDQVLEELRSSIDQVLGYEDEDDTEDETEGETETAADDDDD